MQLSLVNFSVQLAKNVYDENFFSSRAVYPRIILIGLGALTSVAEVFSQMIDFGLKLPYTGVYLLTGWVPLGRDETKKWIFTASFFAPTYTLSGQAKTLKLAAFAFSSIFITIFYGAYAPDKCISYYLGNQPPPPVENQPPPPVKTEEIHEIGEAGETGEKKDISINDEVTIARKRNRFEADPEGELPKEQSPLRQTGTASNSFLNQRFPTSPYRSPVRRPNLLSFKPQPGQEINLDRDNLTPAQKEALSDLEKLLSKAIPENQIATLKKMFYQASPNVVLSREIIAGLFWKTVAEHENIETYLGSSPARGGIVSSPLKSTSCSSTTTHYVPIVNGPSTAMPLSSDSRLKIESMSLKARWAQKVENDEDENEEGINAEWEEGFSLPPLPDLEDQKVFSTNMRQSEEKLLFSDVNVRTRAIEFAQVFLVKSEE